MRTIRFVRVRKFRKRNKALIITIKISVLWYTLVLSSFNFLSSETNAIFTDSAANVSSFKAGTWWDKSSLQFTNEYGYSCGEIFAYIQNAGDGDMAINSKFHVYYHPKNNPVNPNKISGELVLSDGVIHKMGFKDEPQKLSFVPDREGKYKFVAFQHPDKPGNNGGKLSIEGTAVTFSETIVVKNGCKNSKNILGEDLEEDRSNELKLENEADQDVQNGNRPDDSAENPALENEEQEPENSGETDDQIEEPAPGNEEKELEGPTEINEAIENPESETVPIHQKNPQTDSDFIEDTKNRK